jgi:hypothetical protein
MNPLLAALTLAFPSPPSIVVNDLDGKKLRLPVAGKPTVLIFVGTECPIANRMAPELKRIITDYKGVAYYFVYAERGLSKSTIRKHLKEYRLPAPGLLDPAFLIAKFAKARVTPEAAVYDSTGKFVYHGRINDSYSEHNVPREVPVKNDLRNAIDSVLKHKPVANPFIPAVGCAIPYEV